MMRTCRMTIPRARLAEQGEEQKAKYQEARTEVREKGCLKGKVGFAFGEGRNETVNFIF